MQDFLSQTFYGNTMTQWAIALGIAVAAFLLGKTLYWVISRVVRRVTKNTKTELDDFIVDTIDEPLVVIVTVMGLWIAVKSLVLPVSVEEFASNSTQAASVLAATWMMVRLWEAVVRGVLAPIASKTGSALDEQLIPILQRGGKSALWALGVVVALNNAGYDVAALIAGLGIGGLALAMAAKDTVSNVFGGFTIFTDQPFTLRDRIVISGIDGTVSEIGIRSTRIRKLDGREVTIPNSRFADSPVENVSREPSRKVVVNLGLTYDMTPRQLQLGMDLLREITDAHAEFLVPDTTKIAFSGFGDFALNLMLVYYIAPPSDILATQTSINMRILERFNAEGLDFAFPTQTVHALSGGTA
ncbi:MAG: mechanosensitive ion channel family protein [Gemmatimonadetes bacterium]|jgi:MscS family membrane protein|nr:mechanosensitive ion channel family protein [Gemmatimonadota bacterium]